MKGWGESSNTHRVNVPAPEPNENSGWYPIQKRAFVLVTVYSDADRSTLAELRMVPSVKKVDLVIGAFDAVVTVEGADEKAIERVVGDIARTRGVKEAKPLVEVPANSRRNVRPVIRTK